MEREYPNSTTNASSHNLIEQLEEARRIIADKEEGEQVAHEMIIALISRLRGRRWQIIDLSNRILAMGGTFGGGMKVTSVGTADCPGCGGGLRVRRDRKSGERFATCTGYPVCDYPDDIDVVQKAGVVELVDHYALWRSKEATDRHLQILKRRRVPIRAGLSRGEASDLILASDLTSAAAWDRISAAGGSR